MNFTKKKLNNPGQDVAADAPETSEKSKKQKTPRAGHILVGRRAVLGLIWLIAGVLVAFVLVPRLYGTQAETTTVIRLTQTVEVGTPITEGMLTSTEIGTYRLPQGFVRTKDEAVGKVAAERLYSGEYLWADRLAEASEYDESLKKESRGLVDGYCLVSVRLSNAAVGVAGTLRSGDLVDVFEAYPEDNLTGAYTVKLPLADVYVYDVLNQQLESLSQTDGANLTAQDKLPAYILFRCTAYQAKELIRLEKANAMHLVLKGGAN